MEITPQVNRTPKAQRRATSSPYGTDRGPVATKLLSRLRSLHPNFVAAVETSASHEGHEREASCSEILAGRNGPCWQLHLHALYSQPANQARRGYRCADLLSLHQYCIQSIQSSTVSASIIDTTSAPVARHSTYPLIFRKAKVASRPVSAILFELPPSRCTQVTLQLSIASGVI